MISVLYAVLIKCDLGVIFEKPHDQTMLCCNLALKVIALRNTISFYQKIGIGDTFILLSILPV